METEAKVIEKGGGVLKLKFGASGKSFESAKERVYNKKCKNFNVKGFRKGKVSRKILEGIYGEDLFDVDASQELLPEAYKRALESTNTKPVSDPKIEIAEISKENGVSFIATITILPEFEIKNYKGIEIYKKIFDVSEEDVDLEIEKKRKKNAREITVEDRAIENEDFINIDYELFLGGEKAQDKSLDNFTFQAGSDQVIAGFSENFIGKKNKEEFEFDLAFPLEFHDKDLEGKNAHFKVKINKVTIQELPNLDDEFAKDISEYDTLEELKNHIKVEIEEKNKIKVEEDIQYQIIEKIVEHSEINVPEIMVKNEIERMFKTYFYGIGMKNIDIKKFLENIDKTEKEKYEETATKNIKRELIIEKIIELENIEAREDEILEEYQDIAKKSNKEIEEIKKIIPKENVAYDIKTKKALKLLKDAAIIKEKDNNSN